MRFPNAQKGVSNLYVSQLLQLIAAICIIITGIGLIAAVGTLAAGSAEGGIAVAGISGIFTIISGILIIIAFIIMIVGLVKAQKDEANFRTALLCVIAGIVFSVVSTLLSGSPVAASIFTLLSGIASVMGTLFSIKGVQSVAEQLGNSTIAARAQKLLTLILCTYGIGVILSFISGLLRSGTGLTIAGILSILAGIAELVAFFIYLGLLKKAKEAFRA